MNRIKLNAALAGIAIVSASVITEIAQAEEAATNTPTAAAEEPSTEWDKTREGSAKAWDKTKEMSGDAWDATKEGSAEAWDKTKEVSGDAWDATKEGSAEAWDKTKSTVQGSPETETGQPGTDNN